MWVHVEIRSESRNDDSLISDSIEMRDLERMQHLNFDQVFLIYKFMETPLPILIEGMSSKPLDKMKKYFKSIAIQLHPDKNCHPKAKEAFQKIQKAMEEANKVRQSGGYNANMYGYHGY